MQDNKISFEDAFKITQKEEKQKPKQTISFEELSPTAADAPDFIPGVQRGMQNLQASLYGAGALAGSGLKKLGAEDVGQKLQDVGMEGYKRNVEEAKQYPKKHSFKDIYTRNVGDGGIVDTASGAIDWAQGTLGELVPSMAEAAVGATIGAAVGSAVPVAGTGAGAITGAFATRTVLKKGIEKTIQKAMKQGIGDITEAQLRKQVTKQALKKLGGKVGMGAAVMPMESGSSYAGLLEEHGVDAPETALLAGALKTSIEFIGGNSKLVDTFVDALAKGSKGVVKKSAKELLTNIPQEAIQEGGQELIDILNTVANTDEKLLTTENVESIIESMAAGAVGGGAGAVVQAGMNTGQDQTAGKTEQEIELDRRATNILTQDKEVINQSIQKLNEGIELNQEILDDYQKLDVKAKELNVEPTALIRQLLEDSNSNRSLINKITSGITTQDKLTQEEFAKLSPEEKAAKAIEDKLIAQRLADEQEISTEQVTPKQTFRRTPQTPDSEKQALYEKLFGTVSSLGVIKDAAESAQVFEANAAQQEEMLNQILQEKDLQKRRELQETYNQVFLSPINARASAEVFEDEPSSFKGEQQVVTPEQVDQVEQVPSMTELEEQLTVNEQQLSALAEELNNTTDPNERIALQQEGALLYEQNTSLENQWQKQYQEQEQFTLPEAGAEFQTTESQESVGQVNLTDIEKAFPNQTINQTPDGAISIQFKNGKGLTINSIQDAGQDFIKLAIETGQMSKDGKILGITVGNEILLDENFADNKTLWHENKHVLDNLGMITEADNSALNKEFNKLRKANKLEFALSTHEDSKQRMIENRANMFAQIMVNRDAYRNTPFGKTIQRIMDFFQQILGLGKQTVSGLAKEVESGKIYERQVDGQTVQTKVPQAETTAKQWYSTLENAVAGFQQKQATPEQWKGMIKNVPGVKQDELDWTGVNEWLAGQQSKVSKQDLLNFIQANNVQLEEVVKSKNVNRVSNPEFVNDVYIDTDMSHFDLDINEIYLNDINDNTIFVGPMTEVIAYIKKNKLNSYDSRSNMVKDQMSSYPKYATYQIPGGENYKELLITAPKIPGKFINDAHFDEPNILAHVRFNERTDADGNKVLFLEEVQSDWHQEGRKRGYQEDQNNFNKENIKKELSQIFPFNKHPEILDKEVNRLGRITNEADFRNAAKQIKLNNTAIERVVKNLSGIPNAPFKKSWPLLAMKRMVRYAAKNDFDKIAWTTGDQQAERYQGGDPLSQIERLEGMQAFYDKILPNTFNKEFNRGKWGKAKVEVIESNILEDVNVTKEEALKAFDSGKMIFLGQELIHPDGLERYLIEDYQGTDITTDRPIQNLALPITDRMKSKAMREGMPMFQLADIPISQQVLGGLINRKTATDTKAFKEWFGNSVTKNKQGDPVIFYHGTDEVFEEFTKDDPSKSGHLTADLGHFFTMDKRLAEKYGQHQIKAYLKMEKPYRMSLEESQSFDYFGKAEEFQNDLQKQGYDSIIIETGASPYVIVFDSGQAKSIHNQGDWKADKNIYFQVAEAPEQRISQVEYDSVNAHKNNLVKSLAQQARIKLTEVRLLADKALGSISTRLKNVDPELSQHLRWLDFNTSQKIIDTLKAAKPLLDATKKMSPEDKSAWNWARLNSDEGKIEQIAQKYNLTEDQNALREKLNNIRKEAIEVGYDVGYIEEYWPRVIKDQEGFLQATQEISQRPVFTEAIRAQAKKLGLSQKQFERDFPEVKADIISNLILGQPSGIGGPGNIQARVFETIRKEYAPFYMDADAALMQYVYSMTKKIEARKFFGKVPKRISDLKSSSKRKSADLLKYEQLADMARVENPEALVEYEDRIISLNEDLASINEKLDAYKLQRDYTENIGAYIDRLRVDGKIQKKDEKMVRDILDARFHEHGTTGIINAYKNLSYIDTMGSPLSAITQIGDLAWAMYVGKVWTPKGFSDTTKNLTNALFNKSKITKEDLGIERIAQEFADGTTLSKGVSKVFKAVGLEKIDSIGKEVLINNALEQFKAQAAKDPEALANQIKPTFGAKSADVVQEILADNPSDNVKMLLYSRLLDFQPVALSEMPEYYLNSGNGRVFYMLKTYTLKQFDVFRKEVVHNLKSENPQQKLQGMTNMVQLMALLTLANATADEIKDFMLGKETKFSDNVIENFLTIGGASRYTRMQVSREGFGSALAQQILPPMKFINSASKDAAEGYDDYVSGDTSNFEHARIIDSIPGLGKLYYWHFGRGDENKKSLAEQDFKKAGKDVRLFKRQLENSDDKRLFIESNLDRFKQMKVHGNFQAALNRNKAVINKLEKIPSTENVQTRLGQLKQQREQILQRYLDVAEGMN